MTSNVGKRWTDEEEQRLLVLVKENKSLADIAQELGRLPKGISCRLQYIAQKMYAQDRAVEEIKEATKISDLELQAIVTQPKIVLPEKKERKDKSSELVLLLTEIRDLLKVQNEFLSRK